MGKKSDIPFGAQFSPRQINLIDLLKIIHGNAGDRDRITKAVQKSFFSGHAENWRWKLADNTVLAMRAYGLLDEDGATPTDVAADLLKLAKKPKVAHEEFGKHILTELGGISYVETLEAMQAAGDKITLHEIRKRLEQRGIHVPRAAVHLSSLRLWLAEAGVFDKSANSAPKLYEVNRNRLETILGIGLDEIDKLTGLNKSQRDYLRAMMRIPEKGPFIANKIADLAYSLYGTEYNHKDLPKSILTPLQNAGYLEIKKSTKGRGAKPHLVTPTRKFHLELTDPLIRAAAKNAGLVPKDLFARPLKDILKDLRSTDTHVKGKALEILAIYLLRLIDLQFKGWRVRSADTGGAEVDVILEGARLIFSRWQIQAKNTKRVRLDDVAKEVGLALTFIHASVVVVVSTGDFTKDAYSYADHVMRTGNLNVILLNGAELKVISEDPTAIAWILDSKAEKAMAIKQRIDYLASH